MRPFYLFIAFFLYLQSNASAQVSKWMELAAKSDSLQFAKKIAPEKYNLSENPYLSHLKELEANSNINADSLFYLLSHWNGYPSPSKTGIVCKFWVDIKDNYKVPFFVYLPKGYNPANKTALLVYYKGGWLNRQVYPSNFEKEIIDDNPTFSYLDKFNVIEIFPALKNDLAIYGNYGYLHVEKMVAQTRRIFNIDDNKIFLSGFSDGGKTVYNVASLLQTPFACFYPINSFPPSVPHYHNMVNRSVLSFSAEKDEMTNWKSISTKAAYVNSIGGDWAFRIINGRKHFYYPYQKEVLPVIFEHMMIKNRNPLPNKIIYDKIQNYDDLKNFDWLQISVDTKKSPTQYNYRDTIKTYSLEGEESTYEYGAKIGQVRASYFDNTFTITASRTDEITIYISPLMVNLSRPVKVVINGKLLFEEKVEPSKLFMVSHFLENFDRAQIFVSQINIKLSE